MFVSKSISDIPAVQKSEEVSPILGIDVSVLADGIISTSITCSMRSRALFARERVGVVLEDLFFLRKRSRHLLENRHKVPR